MSNTEPENDRHGGEGHREIHRRIGVIEAEIDRLEYEKEQLRHELRQEWDDD